MQVLYLLRKYAIGVKNKPNYKRVHLITETAEIYQGLLKFTEIRPNLLAKVTE